ncbi:MAG: hypothetical protein Q8R01_18190 [Ramlibacter sp.]|nr:hypothetical protein [Ramlibacter sp.]
MEGQSAKKHPALPAGGDYADCLSATELDDVLEPMLGDAYVRATVLYNVRVGRASTTEVEKMLLRRTARNPLVIAPLHVRHHWVCAVLSASQEGGLTATVVDSAPGSATRHDIEVLLRRLHIRNAKIVCCGRQPRNSNECGVHCVVAGWRAFLGLPLGTTNDELSLAHLRAHLQTLATDFDSTIATAIAQNPATYGKPLEYPAPPAYNEQPTGFFQYDPYATCLRQPLAQGKQQHQPHRSTQHHLEQQQHQQQLQQHHQHQFQPHERQPQQQQQQQQPQSAPHVPKQQTASSRLAGGAPPNDESNAAQRNLCYLFAASQLLHALDPGNFGKAEYLDLEGLQSLLGQESGRQHDAVETAHLLVDNTTTPLQMHYTAGTIPPAAAAPPIVLVTSQLVAPPGLRIVGSVAFAGRVSEFGSGLVDAEAGHFVFIKGSDETRHRVVLVGLRPIARSVGPFVTHGQRIFLTQDAPGEFGDLVDDAGWRIIRQRAERDEARRRSEQQKKPQQSQHSANPPRPPQPPQQPQQTSTQAAQPQPPPPNQQALQPRPPQPELQPQSPRMLRLAPQGTPRDKGTAPELMTRRSIWTLTESLHVGDNVVAHWSAQDEAGMWAGVVTRTRTRGEHCLVDWVAEQCDVCGEWREMERVTLHLPHPRTAYYSVTSQGPVESTCRCPEEVACEMDDPPAPPPPQANESPRHEPRFVLPRRPHQEDAAIAPEREPCPAVGRAPVRTMTGNVGRCWQLFAGRPPHVHYLAWARLAKSTRQLHVRWLERIRGMPADLAHTALGTAVVDLVLRMGKERGWAWATISSALSTVCSALGALPLYTTEIAPIDLRTDAAFAAAMRRAQHNARTSERTQITESMPHDTYLSLCGYRRDPKIAPIAVPAARLLLQVCWSCAGRVGDVRQLRPTDVELGAPCGAGRHLVLTFRAGKGAAFWGPYTIHTVVTEDVAQDLAAWLAQADPGEPLFTLRTQAVLSATVAAAGNNLRSIRRGALMFDAARGVDDQALQLLSGHKRTDTLMRYLGWGRHSATAAKAAAKRAHANGTAAALTGGGPSRRVAAPKMGLFSGRNGAQGRRVVKPPTFFWPKPPRHVDLGLPPPPPPTAWRLHIKQVGLVRWPVVLEWARGTPLEEAAGRAQRWCTTTDFLGPPRPGLDAERIPLARLTTPQVEELLAAGKLAPFRGRVNGFVSAWLLPQPAKGTLRPIFEPDANKRLVRDALVPLAYPARLERRAAAVGQRFEAQFDLAAFFDQFLIEERCRSFYVLRTAAPVAGGRFFALTRLPMGAVQAPGVAQLVTWLAVLPLGGGDGDVKIDTMIDNVRLLSSKPRPFVVAVRAFLQRVAAAGLTLNDAAAWSDVDDNTILQRCAVARAPPRTFLGEAYLADGTVCNTVSNIEKLRAAAELMEAKLAGRGLLTRRQFAALVGLCLFLAHTAEVRLSSFFVLLRAYGAIVSAPGGGWDDEVDLTSAAALQQLRVLVGLLGENRPRPLPQLHPPAWAHDAYTAVAIVDASAHAWGAYVLLLRPRRTVLLQQRWSVRMSRSAHAEPRAALETLRWIVRQGSAGRIAIVTDHVALATGQRRWWSAFGGFGRSFWINQLYDELYSVSPHAEIFFVSGELNPADAPSRDPTARLDLTARDVDAVFPALVNFSHPYATRGLEEWQV